MYRHYGRRLFSWYNNVRELRHLADFQASLFERNYDFMVLLFSSFIELLRLVLALSPIIYHIFGVVLSASAIYYGLKALWFLTHLAASWSKKWPDLWRRLYIACFWTSFCLENLRDVTMELYKCEHWWQVSCTESEWALASLENDSHSRQEKFVQLAH